MRVVVVAVGALAALLRHTRVLIIRTTPASEARAFFPARKGLCPDIATHLHHGENSKSISIVSPRLLQTSMELGRYEKIEIFNITD